MVESKLVELVVAGSSPVGHPIPGPNRTAAFVRSTVAGLNCARPYLLTISSLGRVMDALDIRSLRGGERRSSRAGRLPRVALIC